MHFWIDKRSSYGIGLGHSRMHMGGQNFHHHRMRSKSIVTPIRQHPPPACVPSSSQNHVKSHHLHHHRSRHVESDNRPAHQSRQQQQHSSHETSAPIPIPTINTQHVPVIHSMHTRMDLPINHVVDPLENSRTGLANQWLPIYLKCAISVSMAIILLTLKLYYDNDLNSLQLLSFWSISIVLLMYTTIISILRMRKSRSLMNQPGLENFLDRVEPTTTNQVSTQHADDSMELPPPYAVAIMLPEKAFKPQESPPPSYASAEKLTI